MFVAVLESSGRIFLYDVMPELSRVTPQFATMHHAHGHGLCPSGIFPKIEAKKKNAQQLPITCQHTKKTNLEEYQRELG